MQGLPYFIPEKFHGFMNVFVLLKKSFYTFNQIAIN